MSLETATKQATRNEQALEGECFTRMFLDGPLLSIPQGTIVCVCVCEI